MKVRLKEWMITTYSFSVITLDVAILVMLVK